MTHTVGTYSCHGAWYLALSPYFKIRLEDPIQNSIFNVWKPGGGLGTQKASLNVNKEETSHKDAFSTVQVPKHFNIYAFFKNLVHL